MDSLPLSHVGTDLLGIEKCGIIGVFYGDGRKKWFCEGKKWQAIQTTLLYFRQIFFQDIKETKGGQSNWKPDVY